jgi:hypothetical protein
MRSDQAAGSDDRRFGGRERAQAGERLVAVFCLGVVLFSPLILALFDQGVGVTALGVPLLYLYVFGAWALVIGLLAWAVERSDEGDATPEDPAGGEP